MRVSFDLFDVFAFLDRPSLDKAAYVCRRFNAVIEEKRMNSLCLRTMDKVLIEGESTVYNITLWTAHGADGRSWLQFRRVRFQHKLRVCLRHAVINVLELADVGVIEKFPTMLEFGPGQVKNLSLTNVVLPAHSTVKLLLACFKDLQSVRLAGTFQDRRTLDELLHCCSENEVAEFHGDGVILPSSAAVIKFCFGGRDLPNKTRRLRFPRSYYDAFMPDTFWDDVIEANRECGHRGHLDVEFQGLQLQPFRVASKHGITHEGPLHWYRENGFEIKCDSEWLRRLTIQRNI